MAQIAIPLVVAGALYLMSNNKKEKSREDFTNPLVLEELEKSLVSDQKNNINSDKLNNNLMTSSTFYNNIDPTSLSANNSGVYSQYQDKFLIQNPKNQGQGQGQQQNLFQTLAGTEVKYNDINHNNMQIFYNNKSNGASQLSFENDIKLDTYGGLGSTVIEKKEISSLFKPAENSQNVYGSQNQSDFFQSRVNESLRHANTKPWAEIKDSGGSLGFNSGVVDRDKWMPKQVDELRTTNNPKSNYVQNYQSPAYQPSAVIGSESINMVKKKPDTYHMNCGVGGMGPANGEAKPMQFSEQMLTDPNREHTSVSYYGVKGALDTQGYVTGQANETHRQDLPTNSFTNLTGNSIYLTKDNSASYKAYTNSRDTSQDYFGAIQGTFMQTIVDPLVKGLKHTKKSNFTECSVGGSNIAGPVKHMVFDPKNLPTTNREMTSEKIGLNHLNIERQSQDSKGYMNVNPYLGHTQRESTNNSQIGIATSILPMGKSYDAEYNQRSFEKPLIGRTPIGNMNVFNSEMNIKVNGREIVCDRATTVFVPNVAPHAGQMGMNTVLPQQYSNINDQYNHPDLLKAFKSNPYAQPLNSVA